MEREEKLGASNRWWELTPRPLSSTPKPETRDLKRESRTQYIGDNLLEAETEEEIFAFLGVPYSTPEMRSVKKLLVQPLPTRGYIFGVEHAELEPPLPETTPDIFNSRGVPYSTTEMRSVNKLIFRF